MSSLTISSSLRFFITKIPFSQKPTKTNLSFFYRPITFQKVPTTKPIQSSPSSSMQLQPIDELPPKLQEIINLFQSVQNPKAKYEQLMFYGKNLKTLETQFKTSENKVEGCVSQVWVRAYLDLDNRNVFFEADSDSVLTKGLAALLVNGLSGRPVEEVLRVSPDFVVLLGLQQSLTPSRNNGFLNMLKLMQKKALELVVEAEKGSNPGSKKIDGDDKSLSLGSNDEVGSGENSIGSENLGSKIDGDDKSLSLGLNNEVGSGENLIGRGKSGSKIDGGDGKLSVGLSNEMGGEGGNGSSSGDLGSRGMRIREILERELSPIELEVEDISYQHAGHAGVRGSDGETHFNVKVVSKEFEGKSLVKRHRLIYNLLQEELQSGLHALSIVAKAPAEVGGR